MASLKKLILTGIFVIMIIVSYGLIVLTEASRPLLKEGGELNHVNLRHKAVGGQAAATFPRTIHAPDAPYVAAETDDLRPTTPGHSPGVGHSIGPSSQGQD